MRGRFDPLLQMSAGARAFPGRRAGDSRGFILLAALLMLSAATVAVSVLAVSHTRYRLNRSVSHSVQTLHAVEAGIRLFKEDTGEYPGSLLDLTSPISTSGKNICGQAYGQQAVQRWNGASGRYFRHAIAPNGIWLRGLGRVPVALTRDPVNGMAGDKQGHIRIGIVHIREHEIARMDSIFDEIDDRANGTWKSSGTIRWGSVNPQTGFVSGVEYRVAVTGC